MHVESIPCMQVVRMSHNVSRYVKTAYASCVAAQPLHSEARMGIVGNDLEVMVYLPPPTKTAGSSVLETFLCQSLWRLERRTHSCLDNLLFYNSFLGINATTWPLLRDTKVVNKAVAKNPW